MKDYCNYNVRSLPLEIEKLKPLIADKCPFVNQPETGKARWGEILDAEKMKKCVWGAPGGRKPSCGLLAQNRFALGQRKPNLCRALQAADLLVHVLYF